MIEIIILIGEWKSADVIFSI